MIAGCAPDPLGPVFGGGSLAAPELAPVVVPSGPLGAVMGTSPLPVLGVDAAVLPLSDVGPLEEELAFDDDDDPESLGTTGDSADEPDALEVAGDGSGSLGDIGAGPTFSAGGIAAFAAPVPAQSSPTPRPVTNAAWTTRCFVPKVRLRYALQHRRLQIGAATFLHRRCQHPGRIPGVATSCRTNQ